VANSFHQTVTQSGELTHDGTVLLRFFFRFPSAEAVGALSDFYRQAAEREEDALRQKLFPALIGRYEQDGDRRKRFRYTPCLFLSETVLLHESEAMLSCRSEARLKKGGETLLSLVRGAVWRRKDGCLLPPRHCLKLARSARRAAKGAVFYLEGEEAVLEKDGRCTRFPILKKV